MQAMRVNPKWKKRAGFQTMRGRVRAITDTLPDIVWSVEVPSREVLYVSPAVEQIFGRTPEEFYANPALWGDSLHPEDHARLLQHWNETAQGKPWNEEYRIVKPKNGDVRWLESRGRTAHDATGKVVRVDGVSRDITARRERERRVAQLDELTGLPNRALFRERLSRALTGAKHRRAQMTVALVDVKRFSQVNEAFGREMGDALLCAFAQRLRAFWPEPENVARVGSDAFALVLLGDGGMHDAFGIAATLEKYIAQALADPFAAGDKEIRISVSVGIAFYPPDGDDADVLFWNAEAALRNAQATGEQIVFYRPEMNARVAETLMLVNALHHAIEQEQFILHYQPKIESATGRVIGMEALLRWQDPDSGLVSPAEFIPILEETGRILEVGAWAIRKALTESRAWRQAHGGPLRIAVNVSPVQLKQRDFVDSVRRAIDISDIAGSQLDLEIAESAIMNEVDENMSQLAAIRDLGVNIVIDDFGAGHSSLAHLAELPVNALKMARSFFAAITTKSYSMTLVSAIISLAHALDLKIIANGVDSADHAKLLRLLRCNEMQGDLFSSPMPADEVVAFLQRAGVPR
jgi:diguanylate cyclase (GGDEF)-like protein/PAS domain S-box-containing protein